MNYTKTIQLILEKISLLQDTNGACYGSSRTIFGSILTATILSELNMYPNVQPILDRLVSYIKNQKHSDGSYGYWERNSAEEVDHPFPSDLDDTALAVAAILQIAPGQFSGNDTADFVKLLTASEIWEGGPYNTWIFNDMQWKDCDLGVNANIAYALQALDVTLPNLDTLFEDAIKTNSYPSKYYHLPLMILFFISRSYAGPLSKSLISSVLDLQEDGIWKTPTETALALSILARYQHDTSMYTAAYSFIVDAIDKYDDDQLYQEYIHHGTTSFYKNKSVSLALIALALHRASTHLPTLSVPTVPFNTIRANCVQRCVDENIFVDIVIRHADRLLAEPISRHALALPFIINKYISTVETTNIEQFATAQLWGMLGYTTIDAILDNESKNSHIPFALYCIRQFSQTYHQLVPGASFFNTVLSQIEDAFTQECNARLTRTATGFMLTTIPSHPVSWQKSYGYSLPAFALCDLQYHDMIATFFQSFLHAKQLHDDAHDCIDDLRRGHVTIVGKCILEQFKTLHPKQEMYSVPDDEQELRGIFWNDSFPIIHAMITQSIADARRALALLPFGPAPECSAMLEKIESAQDRAAIERDRMLCFLKAY